MHLWIVHFAHCPLHFASQTFQANFKSQLFPSVSACLNSIASVSKIRSILPDFLSANQWLTASMIFNIRIVLCARREELRSLRNLQSLTTANSESAKKNILLKIVDSPSDRKTERRRGLFALAGVK